MAAHDRTRLIGQLHPFPGQPVIAESRPGRAVATPPRLIA